MRDGAVSPLLLEINAAFPKANDDPFARLILKDETPVGRIEVDEGVSGTLYRPRSGTGQRHGSGSN